MRLDEAMEAEAKRWEQQLGTAGQEADELRNELQQTLSRYDLS